jgi:(2Fe-2S) ferredoxin
VTPLLAHGIGSVQDLPVPLWLFYYGAALVLLVSFLALWALWPKPRLEGADDRVRPLPPWAQRILLSPALRVALGAISLSLLAVVAAAALVGEPSPNDNIAPTFVYVVFWLGLVPLVVVFGNLWTVLSPWRAAADGLAWVSRKTGFVWEAPFVYPERVGRWPAAVLLACFAALELAYSNPASPRALALAVYLYSAITWLGMLAFGREAWTRNGEAFAVYFELLSRLSPFAKREGRIVVRPPVVGLTESDSRPGTIAVVAVMLGSVAFDGLSRTTQWVDLRAEATGPAGERSLALADLVGTLVNLAGLLFIILLVASAYLAAVAAARAVAGGRGGLPQAFLFSLVPIALAYAVAHYFSLLVVQGQYVVPLASDPFGFGWDLFGTADVQPNLSVVSPNAVWYTQVAALVLGHVIALVLAHDKAVGLFRSGGTAVASQYAMLALMVAYTVAGLWLLSSG